MSDSPTDSPATGAARIRGLEQVDRLSVPLPHGTEVTTRVERLASGGRRIPQGVVGRVVRAHDGGFDVQIVGVGEVWFARDELVPRRPGQVQFAQRREAAWSALTPCVVLETRVGSHAWGLADERSDVDVRGVFALPLPWTFGLTEAPRDLVSADGSTTYWEVQKAVEQALRADPNTLETLFVPGAKALDPVGAWLLEDRDAFVSKALFGSFGRYAMSQLDKLTRSQRLAEHRDLLLEWLCEEPAPDLDEVARRLSAVSPREAPTAQDALLAAKTYVKQLYRSLWDQGLLAANDFKALTAYARGGGPRASSPEGGSGLTSTQEPMTFDELQLHDTLLRAVKAEGYTTPTPIQQKAIPHALTGRDVLGVAQTGTGKTAAFALPILQRLSAKAPAGGARPVRCLVLTPTRELAGQVGDSFQTYGKGLPLRHAVIFGGVGQNPQVPRASCGRRTPTTCCGWWPRRRAGCARGRLSSRPPVR
ncbi:DEAD/DEAH box helicase [Corallococcus macrosporus]|uniref:Uncharacterized protein n=1 Tax=Myxococcus fulvus (strain ATCC BAA-855 / HW-1) TaxID=483219 RepID=F8C959_MYXFH|nr:DEAD/DEAH box helicase [Corallococcus macrosporus]AEI65760.1 hypothetical protein LILAB_19290 [Corallococcus macrosporus]